MTARRNVHGEGNYEASRKYNDATQRFVDSGRVAQAARAAAPRTPEEAAQLQRAERAALLRSKDVAPPAAEAGAPAAGAHEPVRRHLHPDEVDPEAARGR